MSIYQPLLLFLNKLMKMQLKIMLPKIIKMLADNRKIIHIILGVNLYFAIQYFNISIWWVVAFGSVIGIIWGKVFCRWMCPMGIMMELIMKLNPSDSLRNMYQYHKIGCPIAWVSGVLNKVSLFRIKVNNSTCLNCGKCDNVCYMPNIDNNKFSLYKPNKQNPGDNYTCSKCLQCVAVCPNGSLSYKINQFD